MKTPETDNLARGNHVVPTEWAEQLERERDEARAEWGKASMDAAQLLSEKTKAIAERDEAREKIERQAVRIRELEGATNHAGGLRKI